MVLVVLANRLNHSLATSELYFFVCDRELWLFAGHNYRFAVEAGITQGRMVANMVNLLPFKKP